MSFTIRKLCIHNFVTFKNQELDLSGQGLVLVKGKNMDEPWKGENACGKTLLGDSVAWLLSGTTSRDIYADGVIGLAGKSCSVSAEIESNGKVFVVSRYRKDPKHGNDLVIQGTADASHRTKKITQERLEQIMGCSFGLFRLACFQYGDPNKHFSRLKATDRARILDEIVGASEADVPKRYALINKMIREAEAELIELRHKNDTLNIEMQSIIAMIKVQRENLNIKKDGIQNEINGIRNQIADLTSKDTVPYEQELAVLIDRDRKEAEIAKKADEVSMTGRQKEQALNRLEGEIVARKTELQVFEKKMKIVPEESICDKCGNTITQESIERLMEERTKQFNDMNSSLIKKQKEADRIRAVAADLDRKHSEYRAMIGEDTSFQLSKVRGILEQIDHDRLKAKKLEATIPDIEKRMSEARADAMDKMKKLKHNHDSRAIKIQENFFRIHVLQRNIDTYEHLSEFYSPAGFRPLVMEHYAPILSDCANFFYKSFTNGQGEVMIKTKTTLASGKAVDKIDIDVLENGKTKQFPGAWSNGEGGCIDLSLNAGIMRLASMKAAKEFNFLWLDEITNGLSNSWISTLITILREKYLSDGATILLTSHHPIHQSRFDKVWTVVKENGYSSVEQN